MADIRHHARTPVRRTRATRPRFLSSTTSTTAAFRLGFVQSAAFIRQRVMARLRRIGLKTFCPRAVFGQLAQHLDHVMGWAARSCTCTLGNARPSCARLETVAPPPVRQGAGQFSHACAFGAGRMARKSTSLWSPARFLISAGV